VKFGAQIVGPTFAFDRGRLSVFNVLSFALFGVNPSRIVKFDPLKLESSLYRITA